MPQYNKIRNVQQCLGKKPPFRVRYIGVGGGGGAASASLSEPLIGAGGGGGGGVITGSLIPERDTVYPIVVGDGGAPETNGEDTILFSTTALGGGAGQRTNTTGSDGGSGGGGGFGGTALQPTASYQGFGNDGGKMLPVDIEFVAVAGGGGGNEVFGSIGNAATFGNGGGAGGVITGSFTILENQAYELIIGAGGETGSQVINASGSRGENTVIFDYVALGGGGARASSGPAPFDIDGGSGGGIDSGGIFGIGLQPTASYSGFGNDGSSSIAVGGVGGAGGGGGAGSQAGPLANNHPQDAGYGISLSFFDDYPIGNNKIFAQGGRGMQQNLAGLQAPFDDTGSSETRFPTYGKGGDGGYKVSEGIDSTPGSNGVVFIKYAGTPKFLGGTVIQNNGFTYHRFDTPGTSSIQMLGAGGGGGGAGQPGFDTTGSEGGNGGNGIELGLYTTTLKYAPGGAGYSISGSGQTGEGNFGIGGDAGINPTSGSAGVAIVRYRGIPKATGGTITSDDRYTYHLFETGSADFTWLV